MRVFAKILAGLLSVYLLLSAGLLVIMSQPPARFAKIVAKLPGPLFMLLPFAPLWSIARGGSVRPGGTSTPGPAPLPHQHGDTDGNLHRGKHDLDYHQNHSAFYGE